MRTRVKFCGITRVSDAIEAARLGVDAIGLVFYPPSPRFIDIDQAIKIVSVLPAFVSITALFVDEQETVVREVLGKVPVDCLQFHGNEEPDFCRSFRKRYIKAIRMSDDVDVSVFAEKYDDAAGLLLDSFQPGVSGGTGAAFDWNRVPRHCSLPVILAGGLNVGNASQAIQMVKPYALDVSSGVELDKGIKDAHKMAAFMHEVYQSERLE